MRTERERERKKERKRENQYEHRASDEVKRVRFRRNIVYLVYYWNLDDDDDEK